ncbi:hypothetical protein A9264_03690 [Vibrio sp. UCD-FRSSP16_10]|uniref:hypothetical protein n=1 Tax=unclassified Vibrio TaxID=2614977 RepID=UPI0008023480|nr:MULTISPECIES: hypothetical protein [unclassified Vibrio]OBT10073.1 hypothetical protein A9260_05140 [Vibrio sp. UCD-FRSSP16_30]OBT18863.1 hypothetical protein A9264_03690 [Vibrio sp. UCD-FRSSP16_10]
MINLLPWREDIARRKKQIFALRISLLPTLAVMGVVIVFGFEYHKQQQLRRQLQAVEFDVRLVQQAYADALLSKKKQQIWQDRLALTRYYQAQRQLPLPFDILPHKPRMSGIHLLSLHCQLAQCEIKGIVNELHQLRPFMDELSNSPQVTKLQIEQLLPNKAMRSDGINSSGSSLFLVSLQLVSEVL